MANLGSIGFRVQSGSRGVRIMVESTFANTHLPWRDGQLKLPRAIMVDPPENDPGYKAILCFTPGILRYEHPVNDWPWVAIRVRVRKTSDYTILDQSPGQIGYRDLPPFPFLRLTRSDGLVATDVMEDVSDTNVTLEAVVRPPSVGVLLIELVQIGTLGDGSIFRSNSQLTVQPDTPRVWWWHLESNPALMLSEILTLVDASAMTVDSTFFLADFFPTPYYLSAYFPGNYWG